MALAIAGCADDPTGTGGATMGGTGTTGSTSMASVTSEASTQSSTPTSGDAQTGSAGTSASDSSGAPTTGVTGMTGSTGSTGSAETGSATGTTATGMDTDPGTASTSGASTDTSSSDPGSTGSTGADESTGAISGTTGDGTTGGGCVVPGDCPLPGECLLATCILGVCGEAQAPMGEPCGAGKCDGAGMCLECLADIDCDSGVCNAGTCADAACDDGVENGAESDVDCGGSCPGCEVGENCGAPVDCKSGVCTAGKCAPAGPLCAAQPADPVTGQRCPLFMPCTESVQCGDFKGCQQWFCNNAKKCELNALVGCWMDKGGGCVADVVFTQQTMPPVDKRFVPPDNVDFRELASLAFTVKNNSASDLYLDKLPLVLDVMGNGSKFDVSSVKIFDNSGGTEHGGGDLLVCLTANPFQFPANGVMGPCAGSAFAKVPKGQSNQFIVNVAFAKDKTFIAGRSYRLGLTSTAGIEFKNGFNGPLFQGSTCGVPPGGYVGAWVTAQNP